MKRIVTVIVIFFIALRCHCQTVRQTDVTANLYYGNNKFTGFVKNLEQASNSGSLPSNIKITSVGSFGVTGEYLLSHLIGVGGEIGYSQTKLSYDNQSMSSGVISAHKYLWTIGVTRIMGRCNFHFGNNENFDIYPFISAGLRLSSVKLQTDDPVTPSVTSLNYFPVGVKPGLGLRYFFSPNFGFHSEIALGTPLLSIGISFKFKTVDETKD